jgi:hypothetical protein
VEALARHRDQHTAAAKPHVPTELDGPLQEWARISLANELEHLRHVGPTKRDRVGVIDSIDAVLDHLQHFELVRHRPLVRRIARCALDSDMSPRGDEVGGIDPIFC